MQPTTDRPDHDDVPGPDVEAREEALWHEAQALLAARDHPKWASLSWIALRPLISSLNDRANAIAPRLVTDLRRAWIRRSVRREQLLGLDVGEPGVYQGIVDRSQDDCFLLLGDTGEQDASQYVVVPALRRAAVGRTDGTGRPGFMLICSDVIYPSGDLNDYPHGFYLPYGPPPAVDGAPPGPDRLGTLPVYAVTGNHDWYDGLTGFMHTFCDAEPLAHRTYGWPEPDPGEHGPGPGLARLREGIGRMLWRRPSAARRAALYPGGPRFTPTQLRQERMHGVPAVGRQPGPYYAIRTRHVLLVCIDAGIGVNGVSHIDAVQGDWLLRVSRLPGPKILLTGYPLLVNAQWKECRIEQPAPPGFPTVNHVVAHADFGYVASIGGDIHNFQHYQAPSVPDGGRIIDYVVSGGGGAYLSATHPVPVAAAHERRRLQAGTAAPAGTVPVAGVGPDPLQLVPAAGDSLIHFTELVLPRLWRFIRLLLAALVGFGTGAALARAAPERAGELLAVATGCLATLVGVRVVIRPVETRAPLYRAGAIVASWLGGTVLVLATAWAAPALWAQYLAGWAALTAVGTVLNGLRRRSGWWREPAWDDQPVGLALAVTALAVGLVLLSVRDGRGADPWLVAAGLLPVVVAAAGWALRRHAQDAGWWRRTAPWLWYPTEVLVMLVVLARLPEGGRLAVVPPAVLLGLAGTALLWLGSVLVTVALIAGAALAGTWIRQVRSPEPAVARRGRWRAFYGRLGGAGRTLVGLVAAAALGGADTVARTAPIAVRAALVTATAVALLVIGVFLTDLLRRVWPTAYKGLTAAMTAGLLALVLLGHDRTSWSWLADGLVLTGAGAGLAIATVALTHLTFLSAYSLFADRAAHRLRPDRPGRLPLLTREQADQVVRWRVGGPAPDDALVRRRAKVVFPSTDRPQGPIQQKVSEIFDSDVPPFVKQFLLIETIDRGRRLLITPHVVTGPGAPEVPVADPISIRLPADPAPDGGGPEPAPHGGQAQSAQ